MTDATPSTDATPCPTTVHAFGDDALGDLDATGVAEAIRTGAVGRVEVAEAAIDRVRRVDPHLHAVVVERFEQALASAAAGRPTTAATVAPFDGVPAFIKDNTDVEGLPTCHGSAAFTPHPAARSAGPAAQFLAQGYLLLGKSSLPEFGLTASTEFVGRPATRNPWNTARSVGASSGGSAALVASGAVPIAHANDGGGSIRIPAAVNGLVGLKPTRRRLLDQPGARQLPVNLVAEGVVSRSVRDTARHVGFADRWKREPTLPPIGLVEGPSARRLRIGVLTEDLLGRPIHADVEAVVRSAADAFAAGHEVEPTRLTLDAAFVDHFKAYWAQFAVLLSTAYKAEHRQYFDRSKLDPFTRGLAKLTTRRPDKAVTAIRALRKAQATYDEVFTGVDVVLSPVLAHPAPPIGEQAPDQPFEQLFDKLTSYVSFTPFNNVGGGPGLALPHGTFGDRLPGSIHLSAARGDERTLLELGFELEAAHPFPRIADLAPPV